MQKIKAFNKDNLFCWCS